MVEYKVPNAFNIKGKVVFITGANRGLGKQIATTFAKAGAALALGVRSPEAHRPLLQELRLLTKDVELINLDLTDLNSINSSCQQVVDHFGRIDVLVNNAAVGFVASPQDTTETIFDQTMNVNVKGLFFMARAVGAVMKSQGSGRIINLSSQAGFIVQENMSVYCLSKAAVTHMTKCLAVDWAGDNIQVNGIAPTVIERTKEEQEKASDKRSDDEVIAKIPIGRKGLPDEIANIALFLACPASSIMTGETIMADGGWTLV